MPLMAETLEQAQPYVVRLFRAALRQGQLAHAYLLQSNDLDQAYTLALELAKTLLCEDKPAADAYCGTCRNCKWLADNAHPDFITLSRLTYPTPEDRKRKALRSQITTDQLHQLSQQLLLRHEQARLVVFTDATLVSESETQASKSPLPYEWRHNEKQEGKTLKWVPLTSSVFNEKTANQFLKTLEEPPQGCLFLFLTHSAANLLATVVSRCQVVPFRSVGEVAGHSFVLPFSLEANLPQWWQALQRGEPLLQLLEKLPLKLSASAANDALEPSALLSHIQHWLQAEPLRAGTLQAYASAIRLLRQAEQQLAAHVQPAAVWLTLNAGLQQLYR